MKFSKITLKKMHIEYLESLINSLEYEVNNNRDAFEYAKKDLKEAEIKEENLQYYENRVDELEMKVQIGESIMAELEKMV
ncbi:hypothetical protein [Clostridium sp. AM28-20LB]|uniref:hypothetical protein n=1 Tax=Clostridium sp. AM28-20LB TaxID=2293027 RepID=UPI000E52823D|nr:hypothetical protein [Clostridium sp. AM28-20LB]RHT77628.1 hypothetical protein DW739_01030 [Clostridium sp. AM28-20LB]